MESIDKCAALCKIPHEVRNLDDEVFFRQSAEKLLGLLMQSQKKPVHQHARHLTVGEVGVMRCLYQHRDAMSAGELGRVMDIGSGGVANLLNSLEKKGYINRMMNPADRRGVQVTLSESGYRAAEEKMQETLDLTTGLLHALGREDSEQLIRIYGRMLEIAEQYMQQHCGESE